MKKKCISAGFAFLISAAQAVSLSEATVAGNVITLGADASYAKYEGWMPSGAANKVVLWQNKQLSDIKAVRAKMSGAWVNTAYKGATAYGLIESRSDTQLRIQFQIMDYATVKAVLVFLEQAGDDIVGYARNAGGVAYVNLGTVIGDSSFNLQVATSESGAAYGLYDIEVLQTLEATPAELKALAASVGESGTNTLEVNEGALVVKPAQTNDVFDLNIVGNAPVWFTKGDVVEESEILGGVNLSETPRLLFADVHVRDLTLVSAKTGGAWMGTGADMGIYHVQRTDTNMTFQAHRDNNTYIQAVSVELSDSEAGVMGRLVWARYKDRNYCSLGEDFEAIEGYTEISYKPVSDYYTLSSLTVQAPAALNFSASKDKWTVWGTTFDGGIVRVTGNPLYSGSLAFVLNGGSLRLEVAGGYWNGGDSRRYKVGKDSTLVIATGMGVADGATIDLDGGFIRAENGFCYVNTLTIANGGGFKGSTRVRAGYARDVTWNITGTDPVAITPGIELVNDGSRSITLKADAPTTVGPLSDIYGYTGATFVKDGASTLTLTSANANAGAFKVVAGELVFAKEQGIRSANALELVGGSVRLADSIDGVTAGALTLSADAMIDVTSSTWAFADSSAATWADGATLTLKCGVGTRARQKRLRFGTDANGLTAAQLAAIRYDASVTTKKPRFSLDADGYLQDDLFDGALFIIR